MAAKDSDISEVKKQELEDSTSCGICMEIFKCPKLLPCGHTFCMNCIQETGLKTSKGPGDEMPCPICRQQFRIPSEGFIVLQNNYYIESLVRVAKILDPSVAELTACDSCLEESQEETGKEVQRACMYCSDCQQKLCEECCRHHRKLKLTRNHKLLSINGQSSTDGDLMQSVVPSVCEIHKQEDLKIYCCVCKTCVCAICFTENHEGHKGTHVTKAVEEFRKEIANKIETLKTCASQTERKKLEITKSKQDVHKKFVSLEHIITSRKEGLKQVAEKHTTSLLEELSSIRQSIMKEIHIETDDIDSQLMRLESYNSYCKKIMTKGSACDICRSVGDLSARVNELQEENQSLTERQLKPLSLCFTRTEFEEEDEGNLIGQLKEQVHSKQETKQNVIEELKKENEAFKAEIETNKTETEALKLANEKLKQNLDKEEQANNVSKLRQEFEKEKLINKTLQNQIDNLTEQLKPEKIVTTPLQADKDTLVNEGKPSCLKTDETKQQKLNEVGNDSADQQSIMDQTEFHELKPDQKSKLKSGAEDSNNAEKQKKRQRTAIIEESDVVIVTQHEKVGVTNSGNSEIRDIIDSKTNPASAIETNRKAQLNIQINIATIDKEPTWSVQWHPAPTTIDVHQARRSIFKVLKQSHNSLHLSASNSVTIEVKHDEITRMHYVDAVVSCINHQLDIDGPLADHIIISSGPKLKQELQSHKQRLRFLHTGGIVHTSAGNLQGVKAIIHVVGPQVLEIPPNDHRSRATLRNVFANCLRHTNDTLNLKSIRLPPIGFDLYGAEMVVDCFLDAVETFASTVVNGKLSAAAQHQPNPQHLNYIQLVSNDLYCIIQLVDCIKQCLGAE